MNNKKLSDNFYWVKNQNGFKAALKDRLGKNENYKTYRINLNNINYPCIASFEILPGGGVINAYGLDSDFIEKDLIRE